MWTTGGAMSALWLYCLLLAWIFLTAGLILFWQAGY